MQTVQPRQSAKILMFPVAGRRSAAILSNQARFAAELAALGSGYTEFGSGWYHDEAIDDESRDRRN